MNNKKGVSELVSYVLLIIIAVGLSVFVYSYISSYVPKDKPTCNQDVSLIVQDVVCVNGDPGQIDVTLLNKGLFKVDEAYIRFGVKGRQVKQQINSGDEYLRNSNHSFIGQQSTNGLKPGSIFEKLYSLPSSFTPSGAGEYELEIEPAVFVGNDLALCPGAIITQPITCS
jgi:hypothetical protein